MVEVRESRCVNPPEEERGSKRGRKWDEDHRREQHRRDSRDRGHNRWDRDGEKGSSHRGDCDRHRGGEDNCHFIEAGHIFFTYSEKHTSTWFNILRLLDNAQMTEEAPDGMEMITENQRENVNETGLQVEITAAGKNLTQGACIIQTESLCAVAL